MQNVLPGSVVPELANHLILMKVYFAILDYSTFSEDVSYKEGFLFLSLLTFLNLRILGGRYRGFKLLFAVNLHTFCQRVLSLSVQAQWIIPCKMPLQFLISTFCLSSLKIFNLSCRKQVNDSKTDTVSGEQSSKKGPPLCQMLSNMTLRGK